MNKEVANEKENKTFINNRFYTVFIFNMGIFIDRGLIIHKLFGVYWSFIRPLRFQTTNFIPSVSAMLDEEKQFLC